MTQSDIINNNFSKAFECIKCSNAYDTGEVLSEEKLFKQISERKHSTFDLSKFTVVGSPTITDDGVASGFSDKNYLTLNSSDLMGSNNYSINLNFTFTSSLTTSKYDYIMSDSNGSQYGISIYRLYNILYARCNSNNNLVALATSVSLNTPYNVEINVANGICSIDTTVNQQTSTKTLDISAIQEWSNVIWIGNRFGDSISSSFRGSIDLKHFLITVDGKEVFSGNKTGTDTVKIGNETVEIPYTLSKTGSKIVDVAYRDRVIDLYEQEGQAGYYTIDENNKNFTLPMGEIYGMIGGSSSTGGSGLELCDIGMALYVDETKGLRRYLNGQIVDINTNTQAFLDRLKQITTLHPSLLCTEEEWQTAKTMSAFGQVGKFVFNYSGDEIVSVRIPRVVNIQGLFDLQNLGMTVSAGLPNITSGNLGYVRSGPDIDGSGALRNTSKSKYPEGASVNQGWSGTMNFDASRSNSIYGNSTTVQQEAIQYPYFIQIATGSETENNIINEIELNNPYSLFDSKYSDHELNNLSWLKSAGQWNAKAVYTDAYNELLTEYNNAESVEETEGTVTFKRTPKGYKIALADQETAIDTKYATYGIAWYYILDTTNTQFKLPRTKYGFEGLRTNVGDKIDESLPNIKAGRITTSDYGGIETEVTGAWEGSSNPNSTNLSSGNTATEYFLSFNASRSSSTYKDNAPVQERATQMYLYFYVGETVQNANLIDAGRISEVIPNKLDKKQLYNKITNCLLEVPQRIKLALEGGKMHLYKGSVLTYGDGTNLTIEEDVIEDQFVNTTHDDLIMVYDTQRTGNKLGIYIQGGNVFSQDTQPTTTIADSIWFDTANNKMKQTHDTGATWYEIPLPIGIVSVTPNVWKSLDQVFNGMGYVGNTFWVDKGVKGLIPNGRNEDGTLKNVEYETPFLMRTMNRDGDWELIYDPIGTDYNFKLRTFGNDVYLDKHTNQWVNLGTGTMKTKLYTNLASVRMSSGTVTKFSPREPFESINIWSIRYESSTQTLYLG